MKKIRIGILAVLLTGITGLAAANNPFTDVTEGHWAYNSINKLVDAGIIEGYNNGHYGGDRLITRYEMAQIVAKAMAKGADVDRLAAEFAEELDNLGIRVSNLEEQFDNVKITGEIRIVDYAFKNSKSRSHDELRTRLFINGKINDQWEYGAMLENTQNFRNDSGDENTLFKRAYVQGNLNGVKITAGRQFFKSGYGFYAVATNIKALKVDVGNVLKASAFVGQFANMVTTKESNEKLYGLHLAYPVNKKIFAQAAYYHPEAIYDGNTVAYQKNDVYTVGLGYKFDKSTILYAEYLKADKPVLPEQGYSKAGWAARLDYKGAKYNNPGSWGTYVAYYDQPAATIYDHTSEMDVNKMYDTRTNRELVTGYAGIKGYEIGVNYTVARNVMAAFNYFDYQGADNNNIKDRMMWTQLYYIF